MLIQDGKEKRENASDSERNRMIGLLCIRQADKSIDEKTQLHGGRSSSQPERPSSFACVKVMTMAEKLRC